MSLRGGKKGVFLPLTKETGTSQKGGKEVSSLSNQADMKEGSRNFFYGTSPIRRRESMENEEGSYFFWRSVILPQKEKQSSSGKRRKISLI